METVESLQPEYLNVFTVTHKHFQAMASKYIAKYDFKAEESGELPLKKGNVVLITAADLATIEEDWVRVSLPTGESGWVPFKFLESTGAKVSTTPATQEFHYKITSNARILLQKILRE